LDLFINIFIIFIIIIHNNNNNNNDDNNNNIVNINDKYIIQPTDIKHMLTITNNTANNSNKYNYDDSDEIEERNDINNSKNQEDFIELDHLSYKYHAYEHTTTTTSNSNSNNNNNNNNNNITSDIYSIASSSLLSIDDITQKVFITPNGQNNNITTTSTSSFMKDNSNEITGWSCHWSPHTFAVTAEAIWTNPIHVTSNIVNGIDVHGRIAIVERGHIPIVMKARQLQVIYIYNIYIYIFYILVYDNIIDYLYSTYIVLYEIIYIK
jgi:hypothetical protein